MTRATILEGNIDDELWPELVLAMTYIKNSRPTRALANNLSPHEAHFHEKPDLAYLRILGSTVYVLLHEEERSMKSEKWVPRALRGTLVGFDGHTIYRVHIKDQNRVIRVKDLRIFEDYKAKRSTELPDSSESLSTFQGFLHTDNDDDEQELPVPQASRKAKNAREEDQSGSGARKGRKVTEHPSSSTKTRAVNAEQTDLLLAGQKPKNSETLQQLSEQEIPQRSRTGRTVKLSAKAQEAKAQAKPTFASDQQTPHPLQRPEVERLIVQLTELLGNWEDDAKVLATRSEDHHTSELVKDPLIHAEDPSVLLATRIHAANAGDLDHFVGSTQFDVEEPERHTQGQCRDQTWAKAMKEELDQLHKNDTWILVPRSEIEPGHRPLGGKWVYKVKRDVDGNIARFKARWVVKGYLQQFGVDFDQTFAAVVKPMAFRVLFAIAAFFDLDIE